MRHEITAASGRGEEAFLWTVKDELPDAPYESLQDSECLESLDAKLSSALTKISTGEQGR